MSRTIERRLNISSKYIESNYITNEGVEEPFYETFRISELPEHEEAPRLLVF